MEGSEYSCSFPKLDASKFFSSEDTANLIEIEDSTSLNTADNDVPTTISIKTGASHEHTNAGRKEKAFVPNYYKYVAIVKSLLEKNTKKTIAATGATVIMIIVICVSAAAPREGRY